MLVKDLHEQGFTVVQVDEACFSPIKNDRRHWAPVGRPITIREKYLTVDQVKVCAAIDGEIGLIKAVYKIDAFCGPDFVDFLYGLRKYYGPERKLAVFWDGCSAHRSNVVKEALEDPSLNIRLVKNISYRPDFNGIELFWRQAKVRYYQLCDAKRAAGQRHWNQLSLVQLCVEHVMSPSDVAGHYYRGWNALENA